MVLVYDTETNIKFKYINRPETFSKFPSLKMLRNLLQQELGKTPATARAPTVPPQELKTYSFEKIKVNCRYFPRNLFFTISFL